MSDSSTATPEHKAIVQAFAEACRFGDHQQRIDTGAALFRALAASSAKTAEVLVTDARPFTAWRHINTMNLTDELVWLRWGNVIDGPRVAETDDFDRFREWAPCEAPSDAATRAQAVSLPAEQVNPAQALQDAFKSGWLTCAQWARRDDLSADIGSPAYLKDMAVALSSPTAPDSAPVQTKE